MTTDSETRDLKRATSLARLPASITISCLLCGGRQAVPDDLLEDHVAQHLELKSFRCPTCEYGHSQEESVERHIIERHDALGNMCPIDERKSIPLAESVVGVIAEHCREVASGVAEGAVIKRMQNFLGFMKNEMQSAVTQPSSASFDRTPSVTQLLAAPPLLLPKSDKSPRRSAATNRPIPAVEQHCLVSLTAVAHSEQAVSDWSPTRAPIAPTVSTDLCRTGERCKMCVNLFARCERRFGTEQEKEAHVIEHLRPLATGNFAEAVALPERCDILKKLYVQCFVGDAREHVAAIIDMVASSSGESASGGTSTSAERKGSKCIDLEKDVERRLRKRVKEERVSPVRRRTRQTVNTATEIIEVDSEGECSAVVEEKTERRSNEVRPKVSGEKATSPYLKCQLCSLEVAINDASRKEHAWGHMPHKPFRCSYCTFESVYAGQMRKHCDATHAEKEFRSVSYAAEYHEAFCAKMAECFPPASSPVVVHQSVSTPSISVRGRPPTTPTCTTRVSEPEAPRVTMVKCRLCGDFINTADEYKRAHVALRHCTVNPATRRATETELSETMPKCFPPVDSTMEPTSLLCQLCMPKRVKVSVVLLEKHVRKVHGTGKTDRSKFERGFVMCFPAAKLPDASKKQGLDSEEEAEERQAEAVEKHESAALEKYVAKVDDVAPLASSKDELSSKYRAKRSGSIAEATESADTTELRNTKKRPNKRGGSSEPVIEIERLETTTEDDADSDESDEVVPLARSARSFPSRATRRSVDTAKTCVGCSGEIEGDDTTFLTCRECSKSVHHYCLSGGSNDERDSYVCHTCRSAPRRVLRRLHVPDDG